ncbi:MAG TPA: hypothetical protein DCX03_11220 [Bacteroidales bacterium]|nr:hypothetical protein [Bacteroidales bacterium]
MGLFNVHIFIIHCYIPSRVSIGSKVIIEPFYGVGVMDIAEIMDRYVEEVLNQPKRPLEQKNAESKEIQKKGASVVITFSNLKASNHIEAIKNIERDLLLYRDVMAFRQLQRGLIAGFLSEQIDVNPVKFFAKIRTPYPILRKVRNLPFFETESAIVSRLIEKANHHPILKVYFSLYADATVYSDSLVSDIGMETRLVKIWFLLEAMAVSEKGSKKQKVKALFERYQLTTYPNYRNHIGLDLVDIAYKWRNIVVHCGGRSAATTKKDIAFCKNISSDFDNILEELSQSCRFLLNAFTNSLTEP